MFCETRGAVLSPAHIGNVRLYVAKLIGYSGDLSIEATPLPTFSAWLRSFASGRAAQLARVSALAVGKWCLRQGLVRELPWASCPNPEWKPVGRKPATVEEWRAVSEVLPPSMRPLWGILGLTGARFGGMSRLRDEDVGEDYLTVTTKGGRLVRYRLIAPLRDSLAAAKTHRRAIRNRSPYLFLNRRGNPWTHRTWSDAMEGIREKHAGLPKISPHQLRHLFGTLAASLNFSPDMIQAGLGHGDRRSSENYIQHGQGMADQVLAAVTTVLTTVVGKNGADLPTSSPPLPVTATWICPNCGHRFTPYNEKAPSP